ncbi:unnamed protein product [Mucor hiemalis]
MDIPKFFIDRPRGTSYQKYRNYHDVYGDIVRLGPKTISVCNKDLIKQVLVTDDLPKGPMYKIFQGNGKLSVFSATDKVWHKRRRRLISPAFSVKYLASLEPFMRKVAENLVSKIDKEIDKANNGEYVEIDIWTLLQCFALDIIGETAFGTSFNMIEDNSHFVPAAINEEMRAGAISALYPFLSKFILKEGGKMNSELTKFLEDVIGSRLKVTDGHRRDILQSLIDTQTSEDKEDHLNIQAIMSETGLFLIAGSETTSNTLGFVVYNLLANPGALAKLQAEIDEVHLEEGQTVFIHDQIKDLKYLDAVINETMRINTVGCNPLVRITEKKTNLAHLSLEKDTIVMTTIYHEHTNAKYWHDPTKFIPERWIPEEQIPGQFNDLEAFHPFSAGTRNCVGKNFALQEMRLALSSLLKNFELQPIEQEMLDAQDIRTFITMTVAKSKFNVTIKRRTA